MSDSKNKFDIKNLIGDIKSMINPAAKTPSPDPADAMGVQLAELSAMVCELQENYVEQGKRLGEINRLFNEVYNNHKAVQDKNAEPPSDEKT